MGVMARFKTWLSKPENQAMAREMGIVFGEASRDPYGMSSFGTALGAGGRARAEELRRAEDREEERRRRVLEEQRDALRDKAFQNQLVQEQLDRMEAKVRQKRLREAHEQQLGSIRDENVRSLAGPYAGTDEGSRLILAALEQQRSKAEEAGETDRALQLERQMVGRLPAHLRSQAEALVGTGEVASFVRQALSSEHQETLYRNRPDDEDDEQSLSERLKLADLKLGLRRPTGKSQDELLAAIEERAEKDMAYRESDEFQEERARILSGRHPDQADAELDRLETEQILRSRVPELDIPDREPEISMRRQGSAWMGGPEDESKLARALLEFEKIRGRSATRSLETEIETLRKAGASINDILLLIEQAVAEVD